MATCMGFCLHGNSRMRERWAWKWVGVLLTVWAAGGDGEWPWWRLGKRLERWVWWRLGCEQGWVQCYQVGQWHQYGPLIQYGQELQPCTWPPLRRPPSNHPSWKSDPHYPREEERDWGKPGFQSSQHEAWWSVSPWRKQRSKENRKEHRTWNVLQACQTRFTISSMNLTFSGLK